jgi:hypothetical protein
MERYGLIVPVHDQDIQKKGAADMYVVPALLPLPADDSLMRYDTRFGTRHAVHSCYFLFSTSSSNGDSGGAFQKSTIINGNDLKEGGFLPSGLFERFLGKCILWAQKTSVGGVVNLDQFGIFHNMAILSFGSQYFRLVPLPHLNCMRIDVCSANPYIVVRRLLDLLKDATSECMSNLTFMTALPFNDSDAGASIASSIADFERGDASTSKLLSVSSVRHAYMKKEGIKKTGMQIMSHKATLEHYESWLPISRAMSAYDVFLSYRWGDFDSPLTAAIFDVMSNYSVEIEDHRAVNVFLDTQRLQKGELFDEAFARALTHTTVVNPIVSAAAMKNMIGHDGTRVDNVLLEWILSMETLSIGGEGGIKAIYPIFIGDVTISPDDGSTSIGNFFASGIMDELPDVVPSATIAAVKKHLANNGLQSADPQKLEAHTVKSFFKAFSMLLGEVGLNGSDLNIHALASSIAREVFLIVAAKMEESSSHTPSLAPVPTSVPARRPIPAPTSAAVAVTVAVDQTMEIMPWLEGILLPRRCKPEAVAAVAEWIADEEGYFTVGELQEAYREDPEAISAQVGEKCKEVQIGAGHIKFLLKQLN